MKYFVIILIFIGFSVLVSNAFASCISLPCDDANIKLGEPNYRFIDFSYQNKIGEPITFILEKTADNQCNSYIAEIYDENNQVVWSQQQGSLCVMTDDPNPQTSQIKLGFESHNKIIVNKSGRYYIKIVIDDGSIEREFVVHHTNSGFTLDRTVYPNLSPLQQIKSGVPFNEILCKEDLELIQKYDGSPACVKPETKTKLIERGWTERVDYQKIGYLASENKFKQLLEEQNIEYTSENFVFVEGASRTSYPPISSYCGYVLANNNEDYWYSSSFHNDTLTNAEIYDKNPKPCESNKGSCLCIIETSLDEDSR